MKYLVINTAGSVEIVINNDGKIFAWQDENSRMASEMLLTKIDQLLDEAGLSINDLDYFGCVNGPGSFTGIRIGLNTIKTFAYATNKEMVAIDYLQVLSYNADDNVVCITDGWADNCYVAVYDKDKNVILPPSAEKIDKVKEMIKDYPYQIYITSPLKEYFPEGKLNDYQTSLVKAMDDKISKKQCISYKNAQAFYILPSQAERDLK